MSAEAAPKKMVNPLLKLVLEMGPLVLFFLANSRPALFQGLVGPFLPEGITPEKTAVLTSTGVLMASVVVALIASWVLTRHLPIMPVVTAIAVLFFGVLTFVFQDRTFIQLKPTIVNCLFGAALLGGLAFGKLLLPVALDSVMHLDEEGWRKLTLRWGLFFFVLAGLNEARAPHAELGFLGGLQIVWHHAADGDLRHRPDPADPEARDQAGGGPGAFLTAAFQRMRAACFAQVAYRLG